MKRPTFATACAQFRNRFTMEHVPAWAREPFGPDNLYPAPHFRSDAEWYANTKFPGEPGLHGNCRHCETNGLTWPLGRAPLPEPYRRGQTTRAPELRPVAFISFDNGVCRRMPRNDPETQRREALDACRTVQLGATLLDESLHVVCTVRREASSPGGWRISVDEVKP